MRSQIISCALEPGMPLNEASFAAKFGVSKTPVREAIRQLERENLISNISGRGSIISFISSNDIREVFEIREIIECGAVQKATMLSNKESLVNKLNELKEQKKALLNSEHECDWKFCDDIHLQVIELMGNKKLLQMYREILDTIERIRNYFGSRFTTRRLENILDEHIGLLEAIEKGDGELARQLVKNHLRNGYVYINSLT